MISWVERSKFPIHVIRYEDMLDNPLNSFRTALEFLQLDYTEPEIVQAIRFVPEGIQEDLKTFTIVGGKEINPNKDDLFKNLIEYFSSHFHPLDSIAMVLHSSAPL